MKIVYIYLFHFILVMVTVDLEELISLGWDASPSQCTARTHLHIFLHTAGQFQVANPLTDLVLEGRRKPEDLEKTHTNIDYNLHLQCYPLLHRALPHPGYNLHFHVSLFKGNSYTIPIPDITAQLKPILTQTEYKK